MSQAWPTLRPGAAVTDPILGLGFSSLPAAGRLDHASAPAHPRTDRHAAPRTETEHSHPQRADPEDGWSPLTSSLAHGRWACGCGLINSKVR